MIYSYAFPVVRVCKYILITFTVQSTINNNIIISEPQSHNYPVSAFVTLFTTRVTVPRYCAVLYRTVKKNPVFLLIFARISYKIVCGVIAGVNIQKKKKEKYKIYNTGPRSGVVYIKHALTVLVTRLVHVVQYSKRSDFV